MWKRKKGNEWYIKEEYCYPGTEVLVRKTGIVHKVILRNVESGPVTPIEVDREPKEAHSKKVWRTITSAKDNARAVILSLDWLEIAGITFVPGTEQSDVHKTYRDKLTN